MLYAKPEVVPTGSAMALIQGSMLKKPYSSVQDSSQGDDNKGATAPAYEADE